jgi:hypothetical protein
MLKILNTTNKSPHQLNTRKAIGKTPWNLTLKRSSISQTCVLEEATFTGKVLR